MTKEKSVYRKRLFAKTLNNIMREG